MTLMSTPMRVNSDFTPGTIMGPTLVRGRMAGRTGAVAALGAGRVDRKGAVEPIGCAAAVAGCCAPVSWLGVAGVSTPGVGVAGVAEPWPAARAFLRAASRARAWAAAMRLPR
jgi:hypothetical protein